MTVAEVVEMGAVVLGKDAVEDDGYVVGVCSEGEQGHSQSLRFIVAVANHLL